MPGSKENRWIRSLTGRESPITMGLETNQNPPIWDAFADSLTHYRNGQNDPAAQQLCPPPPPLYTLST